MMACRCIFGALQDITDSRRAQQRLFAAQKLESIGTLAMGLLTASICLVVLAQAELALAEFAGSESRGRTERDPRSRHARLGNRPS